MAQTRKYGSSCRIENWFEDVQLEEDTLKDFLERRSRGELYIQKVGKLMGNVAAEVNATVSGDGFLHFGDLIQVQNVGANPNMVKLSRSNPRDPSTLCAAVTEDMLYSMDEMPNTLGVSASRSLGANVRSVFRVNSVDGTPNGQKVVFGQPFQLVSHESLGALFLASDRCAHGKAAKKSRNQLVELTNQNNFLTHWKAEYFNPQMRFEFDQSPVPVHCPLLIKHCKTNSCLAIEEQYLLRGFMGTEYEVSTHTYLDDHRAEKDVNHWVFATKVPEGAPKEVPEPDPKDYPKSLKD